MHSRNEFNGKKPKMKKSLPVGCNFLCVLVAIVFGFPGIHAALHHPVSRMASANPWYRELTLNAFMVMSARVEPAVGRLVRYYDAKGQLQISRVVGMPGDKIGFAARTLSVNGQAYAGYPQATFADDSLSVPQHSVFYFPDFIPAGAESSQPGGLGSYLLPIDAINGSVLYTFDNTTSAREHPALFIYGAILLLLYGVVFLVLGAYKSSLFKPLYVLARLAVGSNLAVWMLLSVYGLAIGLTAIVPAIYYIFVSSLSFFGLSIAASAATLSALVLFATVAWFSDTAISVKNNQAKS